MRIINVAVLLFFLAVPPAYAGGSNGALAKQCENGLNGKYPNCIDKVRRARAYIAKSRQ